jgi:hypothetical protein
MYNKKVCLVQYYTIIYLCPIIYLHETNLYDAASIVSKSLLSYLNPSCCT